MANKTTGPKAAAAAGKVLNSASTGKASKTAAASTLTQTGTRHESTSGRAASAASQVLRDGRTSAASKTAAGSALSQKVSTPKPVSPKPSPERGPTQAPGPGRKGSTGPKSTPTRGGDTGPRGGGKKR